MTTKTSNMSYLISGEMLSSLLSIDVMSESSFFLSMKAHSLRSGLMGAGGMSQAESIHQ